MGLYVVIGLGNLHLDIVADFRQIGLTACYTSPAPHMSYHQLTRLLRRLAIASSAMCLFVVVGMAVTQLTVHDRVAASPEARRCAEGLRTNIDHPAERLGLMLGKIRIIEASLSSAEVELYTIYRIPLGTLRGDPDSKWAVLCQMIGPSEVNSSDAIITR